MNARYFLFLFVFMPMWLCSQSVITTQNAPKKLIRLYEKAEKCFQKERYTEGREKLEEAIALEPAFLDAHMRLGEAHYKQKDYELAQLAFLNAYHLDSSDTKVIQALAICYEKTGRSDEAAKFYTLYLKKAKRIKPSYKKDLQKKLVDLEFTSISMNNALPFEPEPLPDAINTKQFSEYLPSLTADGKRLFFTRVTGNQEDIYYAEQDSTGQWKEAILLPNLNTEENEGAHSIAADGKTILFTYCSTNSSSMLYRGCNIYASFKREGRWTKPAFFHAINSKAWDTQPHISADGGQVIFVSKRAGGQGESDLWWSKRNEEGKWTAPENLGEAINTPYREESPFFHADGRTLYFKSEGHAGMGSFDLFMSALGEDGTWSQPVNLGYPINTKEHEGALVVALDGRTAYYSQGDGGLKFDAKGSDLYTFQLPESRRASPVGFVDIQVYDAETKAPLSAKVTIRSSDSEQRVISTDAEGEALVLLPLGESHNLNIDLEKYYFHSERFELDSANTATTAFSLEVGLRRITEEPTEEPVILKNVLFLTGSYELKPESFYELDRLTQLLNENPELKIEIRGHTDDVGRDEDNLLLSENRARAVRDYLVEEGIASARLTYMGYGESQPISTNESEEGRKMNRRTEFITKN